MKKKITYALLLTIPTLSFTMDLDSYYITVKGGDIKTQELMVGLQYKF